MTTREQQANRRLTRAYVRQNSVNVRMTSYNRQQDDQGSWRYVRGGDRFTQSFRLIESGQPGSNAARSVTGVDGISREVEFELLGEHCADLRLYDRFSLNGDQFEVIEVWPDNGYETRASVVRLAQT